MSRMPWEPGPDRAGKDSKRVQFRMSGEEHADLMTVARQYGKPVKRYDWRSGKHQIEHVPATMSEIARQALEEYVRRYKAAELPGMEKPKPKRKPAAKKKAVAK